MPKKGAIDFQNTKVAFSSKNNFQLRKTYWLFKLMNYKFLVDLGANISKLSLDLHLPVKGIIKSTIYQQFCGGETIKECNDTIAKLGKYNIGAILDYSVEGKEKESDFEHTKTETIDTVKKAKGDERIPFSVFKVTGMARFALLEKRSAGSALNPSDEAEWEKVVNRIDEICGLAHSIKQQVFIDAEESWVQNVIDEIAE